MKIGFIGIGLIGGSILKRLSKCGNECFVFDTNKQVMIDACNENNAKNLTSFDGLDLLLICISPENTIKFLQENATQLKNILVADVCGVKSQIQKVANDLKLNYCGLHPMAGREVGGYYNSKENLFDDANIVITTNNPPIVIQKVIKQLGFKKIVYATSEEHDKTIAYTSQLCHIVSNAFAKNPIVENVDGFTGGSFEDLTRVGKMDSNLWTQLFDFNRENIMECIEILICKLSQYYNCLQEKDNEKLKNLIDEGSNILLKMGTK